MLCALAALVHLSTDDKDSGWRLPASVLAAVTIAAASIALLADHPGALA